LRVAARRAGALADADLESAGACRKRPRVTPEPLAHHVRPAAGEPEGALVLMHGRGTSEQDLAPLLDVFDPDRRLVGVAPRGPMQLPPGGNHWYAIRQIGYPDPATFGATFEALSAWLDSTLAEHGVPLD